ncbi:MAG: histidine phosphatase family protein [Planctomycetota bacterium]
MRVFIVRHGKAQIVSETGQDFDRPLAERGAKQAVYLADTLGRAASPPTSIVASDATRAHDTARSIASGLGKEMAIDKRLRVDEPASRVIEVIGEHGDNGALCVVGHNPQLAQTIAVLTDGPGATEVRLRTGEAWELEIDPERPIGSGRVIGVHRLDD